MPKLGEMLVNEQLITEHQLEEALKQQGVKREFLGDILMRMGALNEKQLTSALAKQINVPVLSLSEIAIDPAMARIVPWLVARKSQCVPVKETGGVVHVAFGDPTDAAAVDAVAFHCGKTVKACCAPMSAIRAAWDALYGRDRDDALLAKSIDGMKRNLDTQAKHRGRLSIVSKDFIQDEDDGKEEKPAVQTLDIKEFDAIVSGVLDEVQVEKAEVDESTKYNLSVAAEAPPIIKLVNGILIKGMEMRASDIHIEPFETHLRVRFRVDGELHAVMNLPLSVKNAIACRIKIMSELDISERRLPQDGRVKIKLGKRASVDMRVSTLPSIHGEKIVIRLLGRGNLSKSVAELGLRDEALARVQTALANPYGMILVTGPTGSGKSTTLYTALNQLNVEGRNIVTAEDPVEYNLQGITQVNVKSQIGYTFEMALRSFLRQDPDIIMVGEMRDAETAGIAIKAALTGHLLLSTLHTNDCASTVTRLTDMGIDPFLVSAATKLVIAQRLLRTLCPECKREGAIKDHEAAALISIGMTDAQIGELKVYEPAGCPNCSDIGYRGRKPIFEVMAVNNREIKEAIIRKQSPLELGAIARAQGMTTLREEALHLMTTGVTTVAEALKIALAE